MENDKSVEGFVHGNVCTEEAALILELDHVYKKRLRLVNVMSGRKLYRKFMSMHP